jgi:transcriptional regulator with XRE-family HTH domain
MRSAIEQYIIDRVREKRVEKKMSQAELAFKLGFESSSYVGEIESTKPDSIKSYNIDHINEIAKILECSPKDFWPEKPV